MKKIMALTIIGFLSISYANESYYKNGKLVELKDMQISRNTDISNIKYYKTAGGKKVGVKDKILVQCKEEINCSELLNTFNLTNYSKLTDKIFVVKVENSDDIFAISKKLFESGKVDFAHPNFIQPRKRR